MRSEQLRQGNIIDSINRSGEVHLPFNHPVKVLAIELIGVLVCEPSENVCQLTDLEFIPHTDTCEVDLTKEVLTKYKFIKHPEREEYLHPKMGGMTLVGNGNNTYTLTTINSQMICNVKYIHQLQNLFFALTGEEM